MRPIHIPDDWDDRGLVSFAEFCALVRIPQRTDPHVDGSEGGPHLLCRTLDLLVVGHVRDAHERGASRLLDVTAGRLQTLLAPATNATLSPRAVNARADARPIPPEAPVTTTTLLLGIPLISVSSPRPVVQQRAQNNARWGTRAVR